MKARYLNFIMVASFLFFTACETEPVSGCIDETADNYDSSATEDDGSCIISGCMLDSACNYNPEATEDDGSCQNPLDNPIEITYLEDVISDINTGLNLNSFKWKVG